MLRLSVVTAAIMLPTCAALAFSASTETEYERLAARAIVVADVCHAMGASIQPDKMLAEISEALEGFGTPPEAVKEWRLRILAGTSQGLRAILAERTAHERNYFCVETLAESRKRLIKILSESEQEPARLRIR